MAEVKRFYETFHPDHYDIYLDISREKKSFHGKTIVVGDAQEELVKLNQKYLKITSVRVDQKRLILIITIKKKSLILRLVKLVR